MSSAIIFKGDRVHVYHPDDDEAPWIGVQEVQIYEDRAVVIITSPGDMPLSPSKRPGPREPRPPEPAFLRIVNVITSQEWKLPYTLRFE